jgi:porin
MASLTTASRAWLLANGCMATAAFAQQPATPTPTPPPPQTVVENRTTEIGAEPAESVKGNLDEAAQEERAGLIPGGPVSWLYGGWKPFNDHLDDQFGLRLGLAATMAYQHAFSSMGFRSTAGLDMDFYGRWRLLGGKDDKDKGLLNFYTEYRTQIVEPPPSLLGPQIGSAWRTVDGFGEQDFCLKQFYWEQHLFEDSLVLNVGKVKADNYYSTNRASNDNLLFMSRSFSSNPAMKYPSSGLGMNARYQTKNWYLLGGFQDAQGKNTTTGFSTFADGDFFYSAEAGLTPTLDGLGKGNYRFTYWYSAAVKDMATPASQGFSLSCDQEIVPERFGAFLRYGHSEDFGGGIENLVATGILARCIPGRPDDGIGVGISWGQPSNGQRDQWVNEIFYRFQLGTREQLTFGVQFIVDPSAYPGQDMVEVFEARLRIAF